MLVKILGTVDLIFGGILIFRDFLILSNQILLICAILLFIKSSFGMLKDFASWTDFVGGIIFLLLMVINLPPIICFIVAILLIQKGIFSLL